MALEHSQFPNRILPDTDKGNDYTLLMAKAIYYNHTRSGKWSIDDVSEEIRRNRRYGEGNQNIEQYKDQFSLEKDNATGKRKAMNNIDWTIVPYAPRLKTTVIELLSTNTNRTNVVFLNEISSAEKRNMKFSMQANIENKEFLDTLNNQRGVSTPMDKNTPEDLPTLKLLEETGGLKLPVEIALEYGIDYVFNYDMKWDSTISSDLKEDFFENALAGVIDYVDPVTRTIKIRQINIERMVVDGSAQHDFADAQFFGEVTQPTILDIYSQCKATTGRVLKEEDIRNLNLNPEQVEEREGYPKTWFNSPDEKELSSFLPQRTNVLDFVYLSTDQIDMPEVKGEKHFIKESKVKKSELKSGKVKYDGKHYYKIVNKKVKKIELDVWRKGKWVVGTDIVYDIGLVYDQIRDDQLKPIKPFHIYKLRTKAIIPTIKPNLDALQLNMLMIQNFKTQMSGYGIAIDIDALTNIKMGGKDYDPKTLIKIRKLEGTQFYKRTKSNNPHDRAATGVPLTELEGGMGRAYTELMNDIQFHVNQIQLNSGLNDVALAQNPNPEVTFGQSELAMTGAINAIANIRDAYRNIKESVAYSVALRLQLAAQSGEPTIYKEIIGEEYWKALGNKNNNSIQKNGIRIIDNPSKDEIARLYQEMSKLAPGIMSPYDMLFIESLVQEGKPLKVIAALLETKIRRRQKEEEAANDAMMKQNHTQQQEMEMVKQQADKEKRQEESQYKIQEIVIEQEAIGKRDEKNDYRERQLFGKPNSNNA